ncbi:MAG: HEAT repeat domain-containing protein [Mariniphaga sp.]|nr:HEAT repeat domain-containing protein [Mariniphaga sp.]
MNIYIFRPNIKKLESKKDIQGLIDVLRYKNKTIYLNARQSITNLLPKIINDEFLVAFLIEALGSDKKSIYNTVSDILVENINIISPVIISALKNASPKIKWRSTEICGRTKFVGAIKAIGYNLLNDENDEVKDASKWALEKINNTEAQDYLIKAKFNRKHYERLEYNTSNELESSNEKSKYDESNESESPNQKEMTLLEATEQAIRFGAKEVGTSIMHYNIEDFINVATEYMSMYPNRKDGWIISKKPGKPGSMGRLIRYEQGRDDMFWSFDLY